MSPDGPKLAGCCSSCDTPVFEVLRRDAQRRPIAIGGALPIARLATFVLKSGSQMDLTLCDECATDIEPPDFQRLWRRVMAGWIATSGAEHAWPRSQVDNGILGLMHVRPWKVKNG